MSYGLAQAPTPPPSSTNWPSVLGWVGLIGMSAAIAWGAISMPRVRANRRRRRRSSRRNTSRRPFGMSSGGMAGSYWGGGSNWRASPSDSGRMMTRPGIDEPEEDLDFREVPVGWPGEEEQRPRRRRRSSRHIEENRLSARRRASLPLKAFVFPRRRAWPLDNARRAYAAIQMMRLGRVANAGEFNAIRNAIRSRYPRVWEIYGKNVTWTRVKAAKTKARSSRRRTTRGARRRMAA